MLNTQLTPAQRVERQYTAVSAETCRRSLRKFVKRVWPLIDPKPYVEAWHIDAIADHLGFVAIGEISNLMINVPPRMTKALDVDTPILTTWGWKKHGDLVPGDFVFGPDGLPKKVLACTAKTVEPCYRVRLKDGSEITAGQSHLWSISRIVGDWKRGRSTAVVRTEELKGGRRPDEIPVTDSLHLRPAELLIDPYILGAWLGDGCSTSGIIYASEEDSYVLMQHGRLSSSQQPDGIRRKKVFNHILIEDLQLKLRVLDLLDNKHLPESYLQGSREQRLALLQGLLDTDGGVADGLARFGSSRRNLSEGVAFLARSLGMRATIRTRKSHFKGKRHKDCHLVTIIPRAGVPLFRLQRKQSALRHSENPQSRRRYVESIAAVGSRAVSCITVEGNLYLAGRDLVQTHNSSVVSVAFPAWMWTDHPELQFLAASYQQDLAEGDAIKQRRIVESEWYRARYNIILLGDQNRVDDFRNTDGGYRQTISCGGVTTGKGGDIQLLDDPHNAFTVESDAVRKSTIHWHDNAWRSRVNDPNTARRIYVGQRTHDGDVFGHVLGKDEKRWVHLNLAMEYDGSRPCITYRNKGDGAYGKPIFKDPRKKPNSLLCPARFNEKTAEAEKEAVSKRTWDAQYQQQPEGKGGVILKRKWWRPWEWPEWHPEYRKTDRPLPEIIQVLQAYDTAFEPGEQDSFTVRTTWGLFEHADIVRMTNGQSREMPPKVNAVLLERRKWRPSFGELVDDAELANQTFSPDRILVEKKASGHSLVQELRKKGMPVRAVKIQGDLIYRAHMASLPLEKGSIWYIRRNWATDLIEECAKFPNVDFNDQVASCVIAWMYMRRYWDLQIEDDDDTEELELFNPKILEQKVGFYG